MTRAAPSPAPLSALIITKNEEIHIERCLQSLRGWIQNIVVVDSHSTDRTVEIAESCGATVFQHAFEYPAQQKNWALDTIPWECEWVLMLDADEYVPSDLRDEILRVIHADGAGADGYWMRYRLIFCGRWIRHAGWYPVWILRLVRHGKARFEERPIDEHVLLNGRAGFLEHDLIHESRRDLAFWIAKHNDYSTRNAAEYHRLRHGQAGERLPARMFGHQAERKRFIKERVWPYLPARGLLFFLYLYVARLGFLDGRAGFEFCLMHGMFQHFVSAKLWELKRAGRSTDKKTATVVEEQSRNEWERPVQP